MDAISETKNLSQPTFSETVNGGTVCRKAARTGLWGSGEATNRSTRNLLLQDLKAFGDFIKYNSGLFDWGLTNNLPAKMSMEI
jgi:hypothetical protein